MLLHRSVGSCLRDPEFPGWMVQRMCTAPGRPLAHTQGCCPCLPRVRGQLLYSAASLLPGALPWQSWACSSVQSCALSGLPAPASPTPAAPLQEPLSRGSISMLHTPKVGAHKPSPSTPALCVHKGATPLLWGGSGSRQWNAPWRYPSPRVCRRSTSRWPWAPHSGWELTAGLEQKGPSLLPCTGK